MTPLAAVRGALLGLTAALALGACSAQPEASPSPRIVDLTVAELAFEPGTVGVARGETVLFRIHNPSNEGHEAYFGTDDEQRLHAETHYALPADGQSRIDHYAMLGVHIAPFGIAELTVKFDTGDEWVIGCHYPGHYQAGMRTVITVRD